jgi:hypothetical protein
METTVVEMRHSMKNVFSAIARHENVMVTYRGCRKAVIVHPDILARRSTKKVRKHPFFGMCHESTESVESIMKKLRNGRTDAV